ncbi:MAG: hypothetical protein RLZZ392_164 [Pseudomonadota bacterium]|jgi:hypothetical protein
MDVFFRNNQQNYTTSFDSNQSIKPKTVSLTMCNLKNTQYNVNSLNNKLYCSIVQYNATNPTLESTIKNDFQVTIEPGDYSAYDLSLELQTQIPISLSSAFPSFPAFTVSCIYNNNTMKTKISENTTVPKYKMTTRNTYKELFVVYDKTTLTSFENSLNYLLGFDSVGGVPNITSTSQFTTYSNPIYISSTTNRLLNDMYVYLCSDNVVSNNKSSYPNDNSSQVIAQVPLTNFETSSIYEPLYPSKVPLSSAGKILNNFRIFWLDSKFQPCTWLNNDFHTLTLRFEE